MYFYLGATGGGMTPYADLADRHWELRAEYVQACKTGDEEAKKRIVEEERKVIEEDHHRGPRISEELKHCVEMIRTMKSE